MVDTYNERVQVLSTQGTFLRKFGSEGSNLRQFIAPFSIAFDAQDHVYVTDAGNNRVQVFGPKDGIINTFGSYGNGKKQFIAPYGITVDAQGNMYITDTKNSRVQVLNSGGTFVRQFGSAGSGDGQFDTPFGITLDAAGNIYVVDSENGRVQVFDDEGNFITTFGSEGSGDGQFVNPTGIALDAQGNVYVADAGNNRIQVFTSNTPPASDRYTVALDTAPLNRVLYNVKVGQGVTYSGTGTANPDPIRVDGYPYKNGKRFGGNQVKAVNINSDKVLTVVKQGTNTPNPTGGELDIKPAQSFGGPSMGKNGLVTLKSVTVDGVSSSGAKLVLYGDGKAIKTIVLQRTPSQTLALNEPKVGFVQVRANDSFTVDDVVFAVAPKQ